MELNQRTMIIAIARMLGADGSNQEIYEKFLQSYRETVEKEPREPAKVEVFKRPT